MSDYPVSDHGISWRPDERSDARERTLYLLYEAASKQVSPCEVLESQVVEPDEVTKGLVTGIDDHRAQLDELIEGAAAGWSLARMPVIDLQVMRLGVYELLHRDEVPTAVILNEAVELAKRFSTDHSGKFVNGVLAAVARQVRID